MHLMLELVVLMLICLPARTEFVNTERAITAGQPHSSPVDLDDGAHANEKSSSLFRRRRKTLEDRMESTIAKARLHWLKTGRLTREQKETEEELRGELVQLKRRPRYTQTEQPQYSLYNNQFGSPGTYVRRMMKQINTRVQTLVVDVGRLDRWKTTTERRLERLEASLSDSNRRISEHSHQFERSVQTIAPARTQSEEDSQELDNMQINIAQLQREVRDLQAAMNEHHDRNDVDITDESVPGLGRTYGLDGNYRFPTENQVFNADQHPTDLADEVRNHEARLSGHDAILRKSAIDITSLQHQLVRIIMKNKRQDSSIRFLRAMTTNASIPERAMHGMPDGFTTMPESSGELKAIREVVNDHTERINRVQNSLQDTEACCQNINIMSSKTEMLSNRIDEARNRADESSLAVRVQNRKVEEITGKMQIQQLIIKKLQQTILIQQRSTSRLNRNVQDIINARASKLNASLQATLARKLSKASLDYQTALNELREEVTENENSLVESTELIAEQMQQMSDSNFRSQNLEATFTQHVTAAERNVSQLLQRLASNERSFSDLTRSLNELRKKERNYERSTNHRVASAEDAISNVEQSLRDISFSDSPNSGRVDVDDDTFETVMFLNSSFHQIRAAVQRQSDGFARLVSRLERLNLAETQTSNRVTRLRETLDEKAGKASNTSMALCRIMTSDVKSLRNAAELRLDKLSHEIKQVAADLQSVTSGHEMLSDTVTNFAVRNQQAMTELKSKTTEIGRSQEITSQDLKDFERQITQVVDQLNVTIDDVGLIIVGELSSIENHLLDQINLLQMRTVDLEQNLTDHTHRLMTLRRNLHRLHRNAGNHKNTAISLANRVKVLEANGETAEGKVQVVEDRLGAMDSSLQSYGQIIVSYKMKVDLIRNKMEASRAATTEFRNSTRRDLLNLRMEQQAMRDARERLSQQASQKLKRVVSQLTGLSKDVQNEQSTQNSRLLSLETLNGTFLAAINLCRDDVRRAEGSISELRTADSTILDSMELQAKALVEHRKLHRNLTALSQGVTDVIHEHSEALETVRSVVDKLNDTLMEGQGNIDDAVTTQTERHLREVKSLRFIMHNFTSIMQKVLGDSIDYGVTMASVRMRQRSLMEAIDNHAASIDRLSHDNARTKAAVTAAEVTAEENTRQIAEVVLRLKNHQRRIQTNGLLINELFDAAISFNSTAAEQAASIENLLHLIQTNRDIMSDLAEMLSSYDEDFTENKMNVWQSIIEVQNHQHKTDAVTQSLNASLEALHSWSTDARGALDDVNGNVDLLEARFQLVADSLSSIADLDRNVSHLAGRLSAVDRRVTEQSRVSKRLQQRYSELLSSTADLKSSVDDLEQADLDEQGEMDRDLEQLRSTYETIRSTVDLLSDRCRASAEATDQQIRNITTMISAVENALTDQIIQAKVMVADILDQQSEIDAKATLVSQLEQAISLLNTSSIRTSSEISFIKQAGEQRSVLLNNFLRSAGEDKLLVQKIQNDQWRSESRINELSSRTTVVEEQISTLGARLSATRMRKTTSVMISGVAERKLQELAFNLTEVRQRVAMLEIDQDSAFNVTTYLMDELLDHSSLLQHINKSLGKRNELDSDSIIQSIASTMGVMHESIYEINATLATRIDDLDSLISDFQLAFDTSGRLMERYNNEMKIMDVNTTNHIRHFATTIEFLRQIVRETNQAVAENSARIRGLNNSMIYLRLTQRSFTTLSLLSSNANDSDPESSYGDYGNENRMLQARRPEPVGLSVQRKAATESDDVYPDSYDEDYLGPYIPDAVLSPLRTTDNSGFDLASILDGDADQARMDRQAAAWLDPSMNNEYPFDDSSYSDYSEDEDEY